MIRRAVELRPDDGYIIDSLGWVLYKQGLRRLGEGDEPAARTYFTDAVSELERATEMLKDDDPVITRHLGDAYRSVSRFEDALIAYEHALDLDPEDSDAEEIRREIELLQIQLEGTNPGAHRTSLVARLCRDIQHMAHCPKCNVVLTESESSGAACPSCRAPLAHPKVADRDRDRRVRFVDSSRLNADADERRQR